MAKKGRRSTHEERLIAAQMMEKGYSPEEVADVLQVSRSSVFEWARLYREGGLAALSTKFASGRPTVLDDRQMLRLYTMLVGSNPRQESFGFALWTRKLVRLLIERRFGVSVSLVTTGRILKKLGMSPQRPRYRAWQQDPEKVRVWKEQTYPDIRAEAAKLGATIFFADEAGVRTNHHAGTTCAPIGRTPVVVGSGTRTSVNMASAVSARGELHFELFEGSMNAERFIEFCQHLLHDVTGKVFLVVDGSSVHKAAIVSEFVAGTKGRLTLHFLPPYSPELNPDEWVWKNVKNDRVGRIAPLTFKELKAVVTEALERLQQLPQIVRGFFADPHLAYIRG